MKQLIACLMLLVATALTFAASRDGRVKGIGPDFIVLENKSGKTTRFDLNEDVRQGRTKGSVYIHKIKEVRVGFDVTLRYSKEGNSLVCEGVRITKRRGGN